MSMQPVQEQPSEFRRDAWRGTWVIMAPGRAFRPQPKFDAAMLDDARPGPFAAGNEGMTPPEVFAVRPGGGSANDASWRVRVVPNLYPALRIEQDGTGEAAGPHDRMGGLGAHEVIIEDPDRKADLSRMDPARLVEVLQAWRARLGDLRRDSRMACAVLFRHRGAEAGATLTHPHSQLLVLPMVPPNVRAELDAQQRYRGAHGRCAMCDSVALEKRGGPRLVVDGPGAVVMAPYAPLVPFETLVVPVGHSAAFEDASDGLLGQVGLALLEALQRLDRVLGTPPYRLWLRTAPWHGDARERAGHHWYISLEPITSRIGAFEDASGMRINTVLPEDAAKKLKAG